MRGAYDIGMIVEAADEYRLSQLCPCCAARVRGLSEIASGGVFKGEREASYGVMVCQQCGAIFKRDRMGAWNIAEVALCHLCGTLPPRRGHRGEEG